MEQDLYYWSLPIIELFRQLKTTKQGLTSHDAKQRLKQTKQIPLHKRWSTLWLLITQFKAPIVLILLSAAIVSYFLGNVHDSTVILAIVFISGLLGFWQEWKATNAIEMLLAKVQITAKVIRDKKPIEIPAYEVVSGDILLLSAGKGIPGDCRLIDSDGLFVDESMLTGESYPVEKNTNTLDKDTAVNKRRNTLFMGTHVVSGRGIAIVVKTGKETEFGKIAERLETRPPETEFEIGIKHFGYLLMKVTLVLVIGIFLVNIYLTRPVLESLLFSLALAVGLTPQLLPAIISINLAHGTKKMADQKVIVKRLLAIENFGSMNILCSDKTGTLTEGTVKINSAVDINRKDNERVFLYSYLNALYATGYANPIDEAICTYKHPDISGYKKISEVPYDFHRKRLSVIVSKENKQLLIMKGSVQSVLNVCSKAEVDNKIIEISKLKNQIQRRFESLSKQGFRTLGIAYKPYKGQKAKKDDEHEMIFMGFLVLFDPPKEGVVNTLDRLKKMGIMLKIITGDNEIVTSHLANEVGIRNPKVLLGSDINKMSNDTLLKTVNRIDLFTDIEPNQKERIISALRKAGNVVGYMGDGINDATALQAADIGISFNNAVDVAKDAAEIVLLEKNLNVLVDGVEQGRTTFINTMKYVFMATSANFGNMFSMAGASLFIPFLPLLPKQILLTNVLTDIPEMAITTDKVDSELIKKPRRWDIGFIKKFMLIFGLVSSVFDYFTFWTLLLLLRANVEQFRTGWFIESVISASVIVLIIRSKKNFLTSEPSKWLVGATFIIVLFTLLIPYTPLAGMLEFVNLPRSFFIVLTLIMMAYILVAELAKNLFYRFVRF